MKKTIITIGLLLMAASAYAIGLAEKDKVKFTTAVKAFRTNQNAEALRLFTELHKDYPQNQQIKNNYAVVLFADGKIEKAEELLSGVIESNKDVSTAFKNLNKIYDYAAAKAYSNALGTDKEVLPQKLQIMEVLADQPAEVVVASANTTPEQAEAKAQVINTIKNANQQPQPQISEIVLPSVASQTASVKPEQKEQKPAAEVSIQVSPEIQKTIEKNVTDWADVWSKGNVDAYLAFYKPDYAPDKLSHKQWVDDRKLKVNPAKKIQVKLSEIVVAFDKSSADTINTTFKQSYQANKYKDFTSKLLVWKKVGDNWLIEKEVSL